MQILELINESIRENLRDKEGSPMNEELTEKAGQYLERELAEWKTIIKEHPIQSALAASGVILGVSLRLGGPASAVRELKKALNRVKSKEVAGEAAQKAAEVILLKDQQGKRERRSGSARKRGSSVRSKKKSA